VRIIFLSFDRVWELFARPLEVMCRRGVILSQCRVLNAAQNFKLVILGETVTCQIRQSSARESCPQICAQPTSMRTRSPVYLIL